MALCAYALWIATERTVKHIFSRVIKYRIRRG